MSDIIIPMLVRTKIVKKDKYNKNTFGFWEIQAINLSLDKRDEERTIKRNQLRHWRHQVRVTNNPITKARYQSFIDRSFDN